MAARRTEWRKEAPLGACVSKIAKLQRDSRRLAQVARIRSATANDDFAMTSGPVSAIKSHLGTAFTTYWNGSASLTAWSGSPPVAAAIALISGNIFSRSGSL